VAKGVPVYKLTQPDAPLRDSAHVILVRLQEMYDFAPAIRDPANVEELHNLRIAAKRLRYTMEIFTPCFGGDFAKCLKTVEQIQERVGQIHDADVLLPLLIATLEKETERERKRALRKGGGPPEFLAAEGLAPLIARTRAERERLYHEFIAFWDALPPDDFFARVQRAIQPTDRTDEALPARKKDSAPASAAAAALKNGSVPSDTDTPVATPPPPAGGTGPAPSTTTPQ